MISLAPPTKCELQLLFRQRQLLRDAWPILLLTSSGELKDQGLEVNCLLLANGFHPSWAQTPIKEPYLRQLRHLKPIENLSFRAYSV